MSNGYRTGNTPATYRNVNVARLQPGDVLYAISKQDRVAHVISSVPAQVVSESGTGMVRVQVKCQGRARDVEWHPSARVAVLRKAA